MAVDDAESLLRGTPYLIGDGADASTRFERVRTRSVEIRHRALAAAERIASDAQRVLPQFEMAVRSDLVSESNRLEGIETSPRMIRDLVVAKRDLLKMEVGAFIRFIRDDERLLESLGLYRAYAIADNWAAQNERPREFELRSLHALVMPTLESGGRYKQAPNTIGGSEHVPTPPLDVPREMAGAARWFREGSGDAVLDATVIHAWITHIHPFDDGNGRMARLLANLALIQSSYPPLLLRSGADRGQYLDALAASDDGDILPLYDLFTSSLRRVVATMEKPNYVEAKVSAELLRDPAQRYRTWRVLTSTLWGCVEQKLRYIAGWGAQEMGYPEQEHFELLERRNADGNCWFLKLREHGADRWLLWFGYRSDVALDLLGGARAWPSIFLGERTDDPAAVHPFDTKFEREDVPSEIIITPGAVNPVTIRRGFHTSEMRIDEAAGEIVKALCFK